MGLKVNEENQTYHILKGYLQRIGNFMQNLKQDLYSFTKNEKQI